MCGIRFRVDSVVVILAAVACSCSVSGQDLTIKYHASSSFGKPVNFTQYFSGDRFRISSEAADLILSFSGSSTVYIDHRDKLFYEVSFDEMRDFFIMKSRRERELFEWVDSYMASARIESTRESAYIAGYACRKFVMLGDTRDVVIYLWVTHDLDPPARYFEINRLLNSFTGIYFNSIIERMRDIGGMPIQWSVEGGIFQYVVRYRSSVTGVDVGPVPAKIFEVRKPKGYKRKRRFSRR